MGGVSMINLPLVQLPKMQSKQSVNSDYISLMDVNQSQSENESRQQEVRLLDVLKHSHGFELFMVHILRDFCLECLISFAELIQFQQFVWFHKMNEEERNENVE